MNKANSSLVSLVEFIQNNGKTGCQRFPPIIRMSVFAFHVSSLPYDRSGTAVHKRNDDDDNNNER